MERDTLSETELWFKKAFPTPQSKNVHTQLGVHFEEVREMILELDSTDPATCQMLTLAKDHLHNLANWLKATDKVVHIKYGRRTAFLDAMCDQIVTGTGVMHMFGMNSCDAMKEVNKSNFSKFENGKVLYDDNLKVIKGKDFFKPQLAPFANKS